MSFYFRSRVAFCGAALALVLLAVPARAVDATSPRDDDAGLSPVELLGKRLFEDKNLSEPAGVACASCHDPAKAFQGNNGSSIPAVARGARPGTFGTRKTPSLDYASFSPPFGFVDKRDEKTGEVEKIPMGGQFYDGRANDLLQQVEGPLLNPDEMNNPSKAAVVEKAQAASYADLARDVYGADVFANRDTAFEKLAQAVVAYESTPRFHPFASKFDAFLRGRASLSPVEAKGFALFKNPGERAIVSLAMSARRTRVIRKTGSSPISVMTRSALRAILRCRQMPTLSTSILGYAPAKILRRSLPLILKSKACAAPLRRQPCAMWRSPRLTSTMARSRLCAKW